LHLQVIENNVENFINLFFYIIPMFRKLPFSAIHSEACNGSLKLKSLMDKTLILKNEDGA